MLPPPPEASRILKMAEILEVKIISALRARERRREREGRGGGKKKKKREGRGKKRRGKIPLISP